MTKHWKGLYLRERRSGFYKNQPVLHHPSCALCASPKDSAPPRTAVGSSETKYQRGNEILQQPYVYIIQLSATPLRKNLGTVSHRGVGINGTCVGFFKG
jgi:hypothetical protein